MNSLLSNEELDKIRERCKRATIAPWVSYIEGRDHLSGSSFIMRGEGASRTEDLELTGATIEDHDFIAAARQDIPRLLNEIDRLKSLLRNCADE